MPGAAAAGAHELCRVLTYLPSSFGTLDDGALSSVRSSIISSVASPSLPVRDYSCLTATCVRTFGETGVVYTHTGLPRAA